MQRVGAGGCVKDAAQEKDFVPVLSVQEPLAARFPAPAAKQCQPGGPPEIAPEKGAPRTAVENPHSRLAPDALPLQPSAGLAGAQVWGVFDGAVLDNDRTGGIPPPGSRAVVVVTGPATAGPVGHLVQDDRPVRSEG